MSEEDDDNEPIKGKFRPEMCKQAHELYLLGKTDEQVADFFGVAPNTLRVWSIDRPEFREARKAGRVAANATVAASNFKRCNGYKVIVKKWMNTKEGPIQVEDEVYIPEDVKAQEFWLKNREPELWNKQAQVNAEKEVNKEQSMVELAKFVCFALANGVKEINGITIDQPAEPIPLEQQKEDDE